MDLFDPYEERGVDNPHQPVSYDELRSEFHRGDGASNIPPPKMTDREIDDERAKIKAREKRRIRPGFYTGSEPPDGL